MKHAEIHEVALTLATPDQKPCVAQLIQLYLHDFSEFAEIGTMQGEVQQDGTFAYEWLDTYWQQPDRFPFIITADARLAGFVLINRWSALARPLDQAVAEFFVLRKYRRLGVGSRAASLVFQRFPGRWEVPVAWYNQPALLFWRRTVATASAGSFVEHPGDPLRWNGTVFRFG